MNGEDARPAQSGPKRASFALRNARSALRPRAMRRGMALCRLSGVLLLTMACGLLLAAVRGWEPAASRAAAEWSWYKTDTHLHSVISSDALADVGIISQAAQARGYDAIFLSDHQDASEFRISTWTANRVIFEDGYDRWVSGTFGTASTRTNALASTPVNTGSRSLRLATTSSTSGETFLYEKRGANFRSGDIILKVSIFPTRIDAGSGVYVSAAIGGDPTTGKPDGYTTQGGVVSPGKSTVLVWQLGQGRAASSDPNRRVLTYPLSYNLNRWNHYEINVSEALNDIPAADRPLDYNALSFIKMAAIGNGGTADAYFDTFSLIPAAPKSPAEEYIYRTEKIDDFNTPGFKIFPSFEMGIRQHAHRFNFGITDPAEYPSYFTGVEGIRPTQDTGYPAMLNHPDLPGGVTMEEAVANQAYGADVMEVKDAAQLSTWDQILTQDVQLIGSWSSDAHSSQFGSGGATFIYAPALQFDALITSLWEGRAFNARATFSGRVIFSPESATEPYPARYPIYVPASQDSASVRLTITGGLASGQRVRWVSDGDVIATDTVDGATYDATRAIPLTGSWSYVRAEVLAADGSYRVATQPIFFRDVAGLPDDLRFNVEGITTASGHDYTRIVTRGITSTDWNDDGRLLSLGLTNPPGAIVRLSMTSDVPPTQVRVDGTQVPAARTRADFDEAPASSWYYDAAARRVSLKVRHAGSTASLKVTFAGGIDDDEPPGAPSSLTATVNGEGLVELAWDAATDNIGVSGYEIYRDDALLKAIGPATTYTDATARPLATHTYVVRATDAGGNLSPPSNAAMARAPAFSTGFEDGNLARWAVASGLVAQRDEVRTGAWGARGASAGTPTYARQPLSAPQGELFYRTAFKILSHDPATTVSLLKLRTESNGSLLTLSVTGSGRLSYRNDVAGLGRTSTQVVTPGAWHEVQVRIRIDAADPAAGLMEVWFDGQAVADLSGPENFGSAPVGWLQLGENGSGKRYDIVFDDVVADTRFIGTPPAPAPTPTATAAPTQTPTATPVPTATPAPAMRDDGESGSSRGEALQGRAARDDGTRAEKREGSRSDPVTRAHGEAGAGRERAAGRRQADPEARDAPRRGAPKEERRATGATAADGGDRGGRAKSNGVDEPDRPRRARGVRGEDAIPAATRRVEAREGGRRENEPRSREDRRGREARSNEDPVDGVAEPGDRRRGSRDREPRREQRRDAREQSRKASRGDGGRRSTDGIERADATAPADDPAPGVKNDRAQEGAPSDRDDAGSGGGSRGGKDQGSSGSGRHDDLGDGSADLPSPPAGAVRNHG